VRRFFGFRECSVADAEKLTGWLAESVCRKERQPERVREELLRQCRVERIEPPSPNRIARIIGSALRQAEQALSAMVRARIPAETAARMAELIEAAADEPADEPVDDADLTTATEPTGRDVFADPQPGPPRATTARPRARARWLQASLTATIDQVVADTFAQADRRDPTHRCAWLALVDGNKSQIDAITAQAAARGIHVPILIDLLCATRRSAISPAQRGEMGGISLDPMAYPASKGSMGKIACQETSGHAQAYGVMR